MNYDEKTGVFYGVISQNSVMPEAADEFYQLGRDLSFEEWRKEIKQAIAALIKDHNLGYYTEAMTKDLIEEISDVLEDRINDTYENDDPRLLYEECGYLIEKCLVNDFIVIKSPFVTWAPPCSPCVPAAGNLDDAIRRWERSPVPRYGWNEATLAKEANKGISPFYGDYNDRITYCLGPDWFEGEIAPYPYAPIDEEGRIGEWVFPE